MEEDQREAGEASRHAWGKTPRPPNRLEPPCSRAGSWDLICPEDGDATDRVCFHERGHAVSSMSKHTQMLRVCVLQRQAGGASSAGSQPRGQLPGTAVTLGWDTGVGPWGWAPRFMALSLSRAAGGHTPFHVLLSSCLLAGPTDAHVVTQRRRVTSHACGLGVRLSPGVDTRLFCQAPVTVGP